MTADPPSVAGACQVRPTTPSPGVAARFRAAEGGVAELAGVAEVSLDRGPSPTPLTALTM